MQTQLAAYEFQVTRLLITKERMTLNTKVLCG